MELTRTQILQGNFDYPDTLVILKPTKHFLWRLGERGIGINCIPTLVRVTRDNIHSGKTEDGRTLNSVVVRLNYTYHKWLFLVINPYDGGLKTLWFREKKRRVSEDRRRRDGEETSQPPVQDDRREDNLRGYSRRWND